MARANLANSFNLGDTTPQEVLGVLKATGSTDPDVLYAAKEDFAATFKTQKIQGLIGLVAGAASSLTIVLAIIGVPVALFGWWLWRKGQRNLATVEAAYADYVATIKAKANPVAAPADVREVSPLSAARLPDLRPPIGAGDGTR
jgi:hypothetical protein